jgi:PEP-CTERM motif-containing protein
MLLLALLVAALSIAAVADNVSFSNVGGTLSGTNSGMTLTGSTLISVEGLNGGGLITGSNLGTVTLTTGALLSGSLQKGGTFAAGGSFTITGNGSNGVPDGVIFNGSFTSTVSWTLSTLSNGTHEYTLSGTLSGMLWNGVTTTHADGVTTQLTINTGKGYFNGWTSIASGQTNVVSTAVPEPGSMSLLGTGLLGLAALIRRKFRSVS